jgi:site-specific DNA-adenine methylase
MRSPLRCPHDFKSTATLKKLIEPNSVVATYLFFDGNIELGIASPERLVVSHTSSYFISEFWACARFDPARLIQIIEHLYETRMPQTFLAMQEVWAKYKDPFVRSAMFFLLNRCSTLGMISSGDIDFNRYNPISVNRLRALKELEHFHLIRTKSENFMADIQESVKQAGPDYLLIPAGQFSYNLFDDGKAIGDEDTKISHQDIAKFFGEQNLKCMLVYKKHPELRKIYANNNIIMIDKRGNETDNKEACEEIIIANF